MCLHHFQAIHYASGSLGFVAIRSQAAPEKLVSYYFWHTIGSIPRTLKEVTNNVVKMQGSQRLSNVSRNGFSQAVPWSCHKVSDQTCLSLNWNWKHLGWKAIYSKASAISIGRFHKPHRTRQHALEQAGLERCWCNRCFCCIFSSWIQNRKLQLLHTTLPRPCKYSL